MSRVQRVTDCGAGLVRAGARVACTGAIVAVVAARARLIRRAGGRARERASALRDGCRAVLQHNGISVALEGLPPAGPVLLACNHVSWLDPIVVAAFAPCAPVSKLDVRAWPVVGALAGRLGVIFHDRGSPRSALAVLQEAERALRNRVALLNFPEGTTSDGSRVLRFKKGLFGLALRLEVPVVPVAISYLPADLAWTGDATFLPHYLRLAARGRSWVRLRFGDPVPAKAHPTAALLADEVRARVATLLEAA
jgi:1-acyl-sn-glycerol-3-phosphate acyltransferase